MNYYCSVNLLDTDWLMLPRFNWNKMLLGKFSETNYVESSVHDLVDFETSLTKCPIGFKAT